MLAADRPEVLPPVLAVGPGVGGREVARDLGDVRAVVTDDVRVRVPAVRRVVNQDAEPAGPVGRAVSRKRAMPSSSSRSPSM